jgi:AcrR family transcriptional regulator
MAKSKAKRWSARDEGLSRERIIAAAIELLDSDGEAGLTFRALAEHLQTGAGALYWHIANKDELLAAASEVLVNRALADVATHAMPRRAIRATAAAVFEVVDEHPWLGAVLSHGPLQTAMLQIFERVGRQLDAMDIAEAAQFTAASTLLSYILGASDENAANGRRFAPGADRDSVLQAEAARWKALDADAYPFTRRMAARLGKHDDRAEFLAGIDLILEGIAS